MEMKNPTEISKMCTGKFLLFFVPNFAEYYALLTEHIAKISLKTFEWTDNMTDVFKYYH